MNENSKEPEKGKPDPKMKKPLQLGNLIARVMEDTPDTASEKKAFIPPPEQPKLRILTWLKPIPWVLSGLFIFSFIWDFHGTSWTIFGIELPFEGIIKIISVSGLIGFLTNWIAITMLFRPLNKRPILGQGLIPAQKDRIAYRLSVAVSEDLINPEIIKRKIQESDLVKKYRERSVGQIKKALVREEFRTEIKGWIEEYIQSFFEDDTVKKQITREITDEIDHRLLDKPLERTAVKTYALLRGKNLEQLVQGAIEDIPFTLKRKIGFIDNLLDELPDKIDESSEQLDETITNLVFNMVSRFDVQNLVEENLSRYDETRLEQMIQNATNEQLKTIQYLGAVLGTIGGFVIWQPLLSLSVLTVLIGSAYLIDRWIYQ